MSNAEKFPTTTVEQAPQKPETDVENIDIENMDSAEKGRFESWIKHQGEMLFAPYTKTLADMGELSTNACVSFQKAEGVKGKTDVVLGTAASAVAETLKYSARTSPMAGLANFLGEKASKTYDAGVEGAIGSALKHVVPGHETGTIDFDAKGVKDLLDWRSLAAEAAVSGVDAGVNHADIYVQQELAENPDSVVANTLNTAGDFYDSKAGQFVKNKVVNIATKRISKAAAALSQIYLGPHNVKQKETNMSIFNFLQLQPVEPTDDGSISELDQYEHDETIDLTNDITEQELEENFANLLRDDSDQIVFSQE